MAAYHLEALNLLATNQWDAAHLLVQDHTDRLSCLIHAYLHRLEGNIENAEYWYRRAGEPTPHYALDVELERLNELVTSEG